MLCLMTVLVSREEEIHSTLNYKTCPEFRENLYQHNWSYFLEFLRGSYGNGHKQAIFTSTLLELNDGTTYETVMRFLDHIRLPVLKLFFLEKLA